jgi:hypothetical protein
VTEKFRPYASVFMSVSKVGFPYPVANLQDGRRGNGQFVQTILRKVSEIMTEKIAKCENCRVLIGALCHNCNCVSYFDTKTNKCAELLCVRRFSVLCNRQL